MPEERQVVTPFGPPSALPVVGQWQGKAIAFLARHGKTHGLLPHQVNYRANLWALQQLDPGAVLAINAVGSINAELAPACLVLPDQLIDYTWGREHSFAGHLGEAPLHVDFEQPFSQDLRDQLIKVGGQEFSGIRACCGVTQGPRLETAAEVKRMHQDGCDLVGMTLMPEAALARELGLNYASVAVVANWAAGFKPNQAEISMDEVRTNVATGMKTLKSVLLRLLV